jgi:hypothetical protein
LCFRFLQPPSQTPCIQLHPPRGIIESRRNSLSDVLPTCCDDSSSRPLPLSHVFLAKGWRACARSTPGPRPRQPSSPFPTHHSPFLGPQLGPHLRRPKYCADNHLSQTGPVAAQILPLSRCRGYGPVLAGTVGDTRWHIQAFWLVGMLGLALAANLNWCYRLTGR